MRVDSRRLRRAKSRGTPAPEGPPPIAQRFSAGEKSRQRAVPEGRLKASPTRRKDKRIGGILLLFALLAFPIVISAQESEGHKVPSVAMIPIEAVSLHRGSVGSAELHFRIASGFHVNSNTPTLDYLIPTALHLDPPTDLIIGRVTYPPGEERSFPFAPDQKLNVYSGDFSVTISLRALSSVLPGSYAVHGDLKYQACDNAACFPPKHLPIEFNVKVLKAVPPPRKNPGQSPHVHT